MDCRKNKTDSEKEEEFLVQNTPSTPESPSTVAEAEYSNHQSAVTVSGSLTPNQEEIQSITSETDGTAEIQNTAGQMQVLKSERNISSKDFDASVTSSSGNQSEPEHAGNGKGKVFRGQKNLQDAHGRDSSSKKQKTSLKTSVNIKKKNKIRKCGQSEERESDLKERDNRLPKGCKWSFQESDLQNLSSTERITILQAKLQEIRKRYLLLKAELAAIDRTKRLKKKKEQERAAAMSSSSPNGMPGECRKQKCGPALMQHQSKQS
ncbi:AT-rich interactive domain-containing protein 4B-like isoform X2 [Cyanistes caeruleus]|uniref:AT-rich interactive domain-containing protein 4B-like isoform X2 n=1 Tax=Cyanistes caeruleus TaxID=156563 RepID=UPI000CDA05F9|nr:AT-rich interactive domain-containing protein 4B-like isoform X2 [Cyanistes caeruleus]